jgi:outer membrane immunogenic protein
MIGIRRNCGTAATWRAALGALALYLAVPAGAAAADMPALLRGSFAGYSRWDGVNFGATVGVANMNTDFSQASSNIVADMLRQSTVESETSVSGWNVLANSISNGQSFGAFLGYNMQWDEVVIGFDLAYHRFSSLETSDGPKILERIVATSDNVSHDIAILAQSSTKLVDYGAVRMRAGYAFGQFLPYAMVGGALGRFNYSTSASLSDLQTDADGNKSLYVPASQTDAKNDAYVAGLAVGLGLDVLVLPNVFLRAEWEYVTFAGVNDIHTYMNNGRVGVGIKF